MPCGACGQARQQLYRAVRRASPLGVAQAVTRGTAIAVDKLRGVDVDAKYTTPNPQPGVYRAKPYRRPERT